MALETLGKYELKGILGRGAAGTVYDARDPVIGRRVAIKTVKLPNADDVETLEELARFRREAQAAGGLSHPNIVPIFDYGETDEIAFIVMEYVGGGSLKGLLKDQKQLPPADALRVMEQLLAGLQYSHDRGIVHRDIKPDNVMLTSDNTVKIADFGIARIEGSGATVVGTMLGTPAYMSPEQWRGDAHIDARSDIYAAGVMLYHLLTGRRPFEGGSQSAIMHAVMNADPEPPSEVSVSAPPELDAVVLKAMARKAEDRFQSASAFAGELKAAVARIGTGVDADRTVIQSSRRPAAAAPARPAAGAAKPAAAGAKPASGSKLPVIIAAVVAVLVIAGGGGAWLLLGGSKPEERIVAVTPPPGPDPAIAARAAAERDATAKRAADQAAAEQAAAKLAADQAATKAASEQAAAKAATDQAAAQKIAADQAAAKAAADQAAARTAANQAAAKAAADRAASEQAAAKLAADQAAAQKAAADQAAAKAAADQAAAARTAAEQQAAARAAADQQAAAKAAADQAGAQRTAAERAAADQAAAAKAAADQAAAARLAADQQAAAQAQAQQAEAARKQAEQLTMLNRPVAPLPAAPPPTAPPAPTVTSPRDALSGMSCAAVYGEATPASLTLRGVVPQDNYAALRASYDSAGAQARSWDVAAIPALPIYCQVIDTLRPALRGLGDAKGISARLTPSPVTRTTKLRDNDPIDFTVEGPDFPSFLQVDYIGSDGAISHYMPRRTQPVLQARRLQPNQRVRLFDTVPGAAFQVGPPYGTDLVVVIASSEPLQLVRSVDDGDTVTAYTTALRNALDAARRKGVRVSIDLVPVESVQN